MSEDSTVVQGKDIKDLRTLGSMYDQNCLGFTVEGKECRISAPTIALILEDYILTLKKKRKYWHVEPECWIKTKGGDK